MKRILTIALSFVLMLTMVIGMASCGTAEVTEETTAAETDAAGNAVDGDYAKIQANGYFVCGITDYAPMNFKDENGEWTGFDTEFAQAVAKILGVEVKFQEIDWGSKYNELNSGTIDLIWNGFTYGNENDGVARTEYVDFTHSYLENRQCVVVKAENLAAYNSAEALAGKMAAVEGGSSGQGVAEGFAGDAALVVTFDSQAAALLDLKSGNSDFSVIDYQMAKAMVGQGDYADLAIVDAIVLEAEVYAIGARKGSDFTAKVNEAIEQLSADGTLATLAEKYGLTNDLIANIGK